MTSISVTLNKTGSVNLVNTMYYQDGMSSWAVIPSSNEIPTKETWFSVAWSSTTSGHVCCKTRLKVNGTYISSSDSESTCVDSQGTGHTRGFNSVASSSNYNLEIFLEGTGATPTATPSTCHVDTVISKTGNVAFLDASYYQVGMSAWQYIPANGNIGYAQTWFAVAWQSTADGHVCCKVNMRNHGVLMASNDPESRCADGIGNGASRGFEPLDPATTYNLGISLEGSGGTTITPTPSYTTVNITKNITGPVEFLDASYYQVGMSSWQNIPADGKIGYGTTWFAAAWTSKSSGTVCCKVTITVNDTFLYSTDEEEKCATGIGNGNSRGFDSVAANSHYNVKINFAGRVTATPTATPSTCHVDKVISKTGNVAFLDASYYQVGMSSWQYIPANGNIGYAQTWFAVAWQSTADGHVCCKVNMRNHGVLMASTDPESRCADGIGNGNSRGFEPLDPATTYNLGISLEGSGGTTITPTPSYTTVNITKNITGPVEFLDASYYQVGMSSWQLIPSDGKIGYGTTWFAAAWTSKSSGTVCCKVTITVNDIFLYSTDTEEKCATGIGNGNSRGFDSVAANSHYNVKINFAGRVTATPTATPSTCHVDKVISKTGNVDFLDASYYQVGMSSWQYIPSNGNIGYAQTWFAVAWQSTADGHVCCKVNMRNHGVLMSSTDPESRCADGIGNGASRGFEPLDPATTYNLGISLEGSGGTTITPTPSHTIVNVKSTKSGPVEFLDASYYQVGMSAWQLIPSDGKIGYGTTWFAAAWKSTADGTVCCKTTLVCNDEDVPSNDALEKCATGIGNGNSRGFEPIESRSHYNLTFSFVGRVTATPTATPSTCHVDKVISKTGNVDFVSLYYYQIGMSAWQPVPSNGNIGYAQTWFATAWKSTADGHVCCKVNIRNHGTLMASEDPESRCVDIIGDGASRGFEPLDPATTYNLGISFEGTGGTTITPTPSYTIVNITENITGPVEFMDASYYQVGMSAWQLIPSDGKIGYGTTWFAAAWTSKSSGTVCCKVTITVNDTFLYSTDEEEKCATGIGNGNSRGFDSVAANSHYNLKINFAGRVTATPTATPSTCHVDSVIGKTGNVDFVSMSYYQTGMSAWQPVPSNGNIGYAQTWFAVAWQSTADGHVCCKVNIYNHGVIMASNDPESRCVDSIGNGASRGFEPLDPATTYNLGISLEGSGGTTITPTPSYTIVNITHDITGPVKFMDASYYQIGMSAWQYIPSDGKIGYAQTWFAFGWTNTVDGNVCCKATLKVNGNEIESTNPESKCATGIGNGASRGFEPVDPKSHYNLVLKMVASSDITPTPQECTVSYVISGVECVELYQLWYYQTSIGSWQILSEPYKIPFAKTWFGVTWRSVVPGHTCCKTNLRLNGALVGSTDLLELCVDEIGGTGSRTFDELPAQTLYDLGIEFDTVCGSTPTPTPTETKIYFNVTGAPGVELFKLLYWQDGMTSWGEITGAMNIPFKQTTLSVQWKSTVADPICVKTNMTVNDKTVSSQDDEQKCVTGIGNGWSRVFDKLELLEYIGIDITFESDFEPITGDHFKVTVTDIPSEGIKVDCFELETLLGYEECIYGWCGTRHVADKEIKTPVPTSTTLIFSTEDGLKVGKKYAFNPRYTFMDVLRGLAIPKTRFVELKAGANDISMKGYYPPYGWQTDICNTFDVGEKDCVQSFYRLGTEFLYSANSWSKALYGKDLEGNQASANKWDYLFMCLDMIPIVGKVKYVGRLKISSLGNDLLKVDQELGGGKVLTWIDEIGKAELLVAVSRMDANDYVNMIDLLRDNNMAGAKSLVLSHINTDVVSGSTDVLKIAGEQILDAADNVVSKAAQVAKEAGYDFAFSDVILKEASQHTASLRGMQEFLINNSMMDSPGLMFYLIKTNLDKFTRIIPGTESMAKGGISMADVYWLEALNTPGHAAVLKNSGLLDEYVTRFNAWYQKDPQKVRKLISMYPQGDIDRMAAEMSSHGYKGSAIYYGVAKAVDNGVQNGGVLKTIENVADEVGDQTEYIKPVTDDIIEDIIENVPPQAEEVTKVTKGLEAMEQQAENSTGVFRTLWNTVKSGIEKKMDKDWDAMSNTEKFIGYIKWTFIGCFLLFIIEEALQLITFSFIPIQAQTYSWDKKTQREKDDIISFYQENIDWAKKQVNSLTVMQVLISLSCLPFAPVYWKIIDGVQRYLVNQQWTVDQLTSDRNPLGGWDADIRIACNVDGVNIDINGTPKEKIGRTYGQDYAVVISDKQDVTTFVIVGRKAGYVQARQIVEMTSNDMNSFVSVYLELQPEPNLGGMDNPKTSTEAKKAEMGLDENDLPESLGGTKSDGEWWSGETIGSIEVKSDPYGAKIFLDGIDQEKTTTSTITSPIGDHIVKCSKVGYQDAEEHVFVEANKTKSVLITLPLKADGTVKCFCRDDTYCERGADILVDGVATGDKTTNKPFSRDIKVPSGKHTISYNLFGVMGCSGEVTVPPNGETSFEGQLEGLLDPNQTGVITTVTEILDGDTIRTELTKDLPIPSVRLVGYDAPESGTTGGAESTALLSELIPVGSQVKLRIWKYQPLGLYNRVLAGVFKQDGTDVSLEMLKSCLVEIAKPAYQDKFPWVDWDEYKIAECYGSFTGDLTISCYTSYGDEERSATIYVDNQDKGNAPLTVKDLKEGVHTVRVEKSGFNACKWCDSSPGCANFGDVRGPCSFEVHINRNEVTFLSVVLQSVMQYPFEFESNPYNASISVDGQVIR